MIFGRFFEEIIVSRPLVRRPSSGLAPISRKVFRYAILVSLLTVFLLPFSARAAYAAGGGALLGDILKKTEARYQQIQAFTATFRQATTSSAAGTLTPGEASGRLYYSKPRQMRWEYEKPEPQVFTANNHYAWLYAPSENQVALFDANKLFASPLAQTFFNGAIGLKNHFEITLDSAQSTRSSAVLKLIPKQEDPNIKILFLWIDLQNYRITRIDSQDILGNTNKIILESLSQVPSLDQKLFHLEVPEAAAVVDTEGRVLSAAEVGELKSRIVSGKAP